MNVLNHKRWISGVGLDIGSQVEWELQATGEVEESCDQEIEQIYVWLYSWNEAPIFMTSGIGSVYERVSGIGATSNRASGIGT